MRKIGAIFKRELLVLFVSPAAYCVITGFVILAGFFFFSYLESYDRLVRDYAAMPFGTGKVVELNLNQRVVEWYYHTLVVLMIFLVPLLTMRSLAEERRGGTLEFLLTAPLSVEAIVLGKFFALSSFLGLLLLLAGLFPALLWYLSSPPPEVLPILSGFAGVLLCGLGFISVGLAASACTGSQLAAGMAATVLLLLLYLLFVLAESLGSAGAALVQTLSPFWQVRGLVEGVVSVKALVYFASLIFVGLFLCQRALDVQRWR